MPLNIFLKYNFKILYPNSLKYVLERETDKVVMYVKITLMRMMECYLVYGIYPNPDMRKSVKQYYNKIACITLNGKNILSVIVKPLNNFPKQC